MTGSLLLSRVLGIFRDTAMTAKFGSSGLTDSYRLSFAVPDAIFFLIAGGALSSAFIPVYSELLHTDREDEAAKLFNSVVTIMSLAVTVLIAAAWLGAGPMTHFFANGKDPSLFPLIIRMTRIILPTQFAFFIGGLLFGTLYARQKFAMPGIAPNVYNLGIILGAVVISHFVSPGIVGMAWGALIGGCIGNLVLPLWATHRMGIRYRPSLDFKAPGVKKVFQLMLPVVLGLSLPAVYAIIMQKFASGYQVGTNTSIDLSNKLMQAPLGIFGQSLALAAFPALSQFFAQKRMDMFRNQLAASLRTVLYLSIPASILTGALAHQIVTLAFGYGKMQPDAIPPIVNCLQLFSIGVFAWCTHPVLMRSFYAMHRSAMPIVAGTVTTAIFIGLYFWIKTFYIVRISDTGVDAGLGYLALPLSGSIAAIFMSICLCALAYRNTGGFDVPGVLKTLIKSAVAAAVAGGIAYTAFHVKFNLGPLHYDTPTFGKLKTFLLFGVVFCVASWAYYYITRLLKMPESETISRAMGKARRKMGFASPVD
jgi:putative peptidoglycan lipid II flippase